MSFTASGLGYAVDGTPLLDSVDLRLAPGRLHVVLGPNGAGKSTLLRLLSGELAPSGGRVELNGRPLADWSPAERARQRAVLPQHHALAFGFTAHQVVELGRLPCARRDADGEAAVVAAALALAGVPALGPRRYPSLSGGERARVQLARVMAQLWEPPDGALAGCARFLLLDEPTASLDLAHQHDCLRAMRTLTGRGLGVLAVLHDPNLALRYADEVTLLHRGRVLAAGTPSQALRAEALEQLYGVPVRLVAVEGEAAPLVVVR